MISIRQAIIDGDAGASLGDAATFLECLVRKFADESAVLNIGAAFFHFFSGFAANHVLRSCSISNIQFRKEICITSEKKRAARNFRFIDPTFLQS